jgi:hypothetical protein
MNIRRKYFRSIIFIAILAYIQTLVPLSVFAQVNECGYDPAHPDLEHARQSFRQINYNCAEQELKDLLARSDISLEEKANAHVLLAAVYYTIMRDAQEKEQKVVEQFAEAFRVYQDWSGDLDIKSSRFEELMEKAKTMVEEEEAKAQEQPVVEEQPGKEGQMQKKPWYKKWWAIALGVGVVAGVAVAVAGGGGGSDGGGGPLPDFPSTPSKAKDGKKTGK